MPAPTLNRTGQRLYDSVDPLARDTDAATGYQLALYCGALGLMLDGIAVEALDDPATGAPGWTNISNPDTGNAAYLDFVGQFVGVQRPPNLNDAGMRLRIKNTDGFKRGTPDAVAAAPKPFLTGGKRVTLYERTKADGTPDPYYFIAITYAAETPDPASALVALQQQKPAGLVMTYRTDPGWSVGQFEAAFAGQNVGNAEAAYASVGALENNLP